MRLSPGLGCGGGMLPMRYVPTGQLIVQSILVVHSILTTAPRFVRLDPPLPCLPCAHRCIRMPLASAMPDLLCSELAAALGSSLV